MEHGLGRRRPAASLLEISRVLEETARLVRQHAGPVAPFPFASSEGEERKPDADDPDPGPPGPETDPSWIRGLLDLRALRHEFLGFEASDAALSMMLALYAAALDGRRLHQTALAVAARVPETTALRITYRFLESGVFTRQSDTDDRRLLLLSLSDPFAARLRAYLTAAARLAPVLA